MAHTLNIHRPTLYFFIFIGALTLLVMLKVELPLMLGMNPQWEHKINSYRWLLHIHAVFASMALLSAPLQFFANLRRNHLHLHRILGRTYALSILISAPIGIYIAVVHLSNNEKWAAAAQGLLWLSCTFAAVYTAMKKQIFMHTIWITRSYALTLTFVLSRLIVDVCKVEISPAIGGNAGLILITTFLMIIGADVISMSSTRDRARTYSVPHSTGSLDSIP